MRRVLEGHIGHSDRMLTWVCKGTREVLTHLEGGNVCSSRWVPELVVVKFWDELGSKVVCDGSRSIGMER